MRPHGTLAALFYTVWRRQTNVSRDPLTLISRRSSNILLHPDHVVRLPQPGAQLAIEIGGPLDAEVMHLPAGTVVDELNNPRIFQPALQRKGRDEVIFARHESGEAYPRHEDQPSLLRDNLDVSERLNQRDVSPRQREDRGLRSGEERFQREPTARVP